jgi:hypothetical protein
MLVNINRVFKDAVIEKNIDTLEKVLSSSDIRVDLIEEFSKYNDISLLISMVSKFRSKGLSINILEYCDSIASRNLTPKSKMVKFKPLKIKYINYKNIEKNKKNYLQEDTFLKNRIKSSDVCKN